MAGAWPFIAAALVADGLAGLAGGLLSERFLSRHRAPLITFAAGAMLAAVFVDMLPEALHDFGGAALPWAFASFSLLAVLEPALDHGHGAPRSAALPAALLGSDALHNVGDGAAVAAAFLVSSRAGVATAVAVIAHEVPQEVGDYAILRDAGWPRPRALLALGLVQLTAALGAVGLWIAAGLIERANGAVLALAAGTFLYIGATDLLPELKAGRTPSEQRSRLLGFLLGAATLLAASWMEARWLTPE